MELQIFNSREFGQIRAVEINNEPYFVGKDVAEALGYQVPKKAIYDHVDDDDKGVTKCDTLSSEKRSENEPRKNERNLKSMNKREAYLKLEEEINDISASAEKAHLLISDLTDEFFATYPRTHDEEKMKIFEMNYYGILSEIIFDYVYRIKKTAEKIQSYER